MTDNGAEALAAWGAQLDALVEAQREKLDTLLTAKQVAKGLRISLSAAYRVPGGVRVGGFVRWPLAAVEAAGRAQPPFDPCEALQPMAVAATAILLSTKSLAVLLDTTPKQIANMRARGQLPAPLDLPGARLRWRRSDIERWLASK